jgi:hypothetical protein
MRMLRSSATWWIPGSLNCGRWSSPCSRSRSWKDRTIEGCRSRLPKLRQAAEDAKAAERAAEDQEDAAIRVRDLRIAEEQKADANLPFPRRTRRTRLSGSARLRRG